MCSIVGSFSKDKFRELITLNQSRGSFSYSFLVLNPETQEKVSLTQEFGPFDFKVLDTVPDGMYYLGHTQAPTGGLIKDRSRIHPASNVDCFLFHNGIIKQKDVDRLQKELNTDEQWDSKLMLMDIKSKGLLESVNTIDGSFACILKDTYSLRVFRSAAGTLFVDSNLNISSTNFGSGFRIKHDTIFNMDLKSKKMLELATFKSKSNPYFY